MENFDFYKVDRKYIYSCLSEIHKFEKFISKINKTDSTDYKSEEGYLIKYEDYETIKSQIHYKDILFEGNKNISFSREVFQEYVIKYKIKDEFIKAIPIKINEPKELINLIQNNNKYLLIRKKLGDLICQKDQFYNYIYQYFINNMNMKFFDITFERNNNIIDENSYIFGNEKIANLVDSLIKYYNFEKKFDDIYNLSKDGEGYLVDINWIEEWKKLCNYEEFKKEIKKPKYELKKKLYFYQKNTKIQNDLPKLKPINFNDIIINFENNSLVLINTNFYNIFINNNTNSENKIKYQKCYEHISIIFQKKHMDLISKNNIILDKNSASIQILIKIYNFQEKIQKIENYNNILNKIGIVDKIWIQNFKNEFQYEKICHEIKKNKNEEEIINYLKIK